MYPQSVQCAGHRFHHVTKCNEELSTAEMLQMEKSKHMGNLI